MVQARLHSETKGSPYRGELYTESGDQTHPSDPVQVGVTYGALVLKPPFLGSDEFFDRAGSSDVAESPVTVSHFVSTKTRSVVHITVGDINAEEPHPGLATHEQRSDVAGKVSAWIVNRLNDIEQDIINV